MSAQMDKLLATRENARQKLHKAQMEEKRIGLIKKYGTPNELTAELLNTLIEKNLIHEPVKYPSGLKDQEIEIFYRFVDKIE